MILFCNIIDYTVDQTEIIQMSIKLNDQIIEIVTFDQIESGTENVIILFHNIIRLYCWSNWKIEPSKI